MHPDRHVDSDRDVDAARRAMQDVNEAWRVLRDPTRRAAYDLGLAGATATVRAADASAVDDDDDWMDRPYRGRPAEPGDLTLAAVRAAPWIAVLVVLGAIIVFTAFARHTDSTREL